MKKITKETWKQTKHFELDKALEFIKVQPITENWKGKKILDFGCGSGRATASLAINGAIPYGLDILQSNLDNAKELCNKIKIKANFKLVGEKEDIPYPDNFFDGIICDGVLHHIPHAKEIVDEFRRVLKPNGVIYLMLYTADLFKIHLNNIINMIRNTPEKSWQRCFGELTDKCQYTDFYTQGNVIDLFSVRGFKTAKMTPFNSGQFMAVRVQ